MEPSKQYRRKDGQGEGKQEASGASSVSEGQAQRQNYGSRKKKQQAAARALRDYVRNEMRDQRIADKDMYQVMVDEQGGEHLDASKINVYMDDAKFVPKADVARLIDLPFANIGVVNAVRNGCPYDKSLEIIDLKLDVMGPQEDQYYGALPYLVKNIRRGNTLIHA